MKTWANLCWRGTCFCGNCLWCFCVWTLWLGLALLLTFQIYIAFAHELAVPPFLTRAIETRLAASGVKASFGRTTFDPSGRVLIENARLALGSLEEPAATAQLLYVQVDPWALLAGRFEPRQLRASGVSFWVPAMLSATGRSESIVHDVDFTVTPSDHGINLHQFTARLATLAVTGRGTINVGALRHKTAAPLPLAELLAIYYPVFCRQLVGIADRLAILDTPSVDIFFRPSDNRGAIAQVTLRALGVKSDAPVAFSTGPLQVAARLPMWGKTPFVARVAVVADAVQLPQQVTIDHLRTTVRARVFPENFSATLRRAELDFGNLSTPDLTVRAGSARIVGATPDQWRVDLVGRFENEPVALAADINPLDRSGRVHASGRFDPVLLRAVSRRVGRDVRPFIDFATAPEFDFNVQLAPGGKFTGLEGRLVTGRVFAYHVTFDRATGHIAFDGNHFLATDAEAHVGDNFARGSFEQDLKSREFRFLLQGRLRPLDISGWFREWWPHFWENFDFTAAAPDAAVDVQGRWGSGWETSVFVFADCRSPVIRGVPLDHALTLIYLRPHYYDGMEVFATRGTGAARGSFVRRLADHGFALKRMDFDFDSSLALNDAAGLVGPELEKIVAPFKFTNAPNIKTSGFLSGDENATVAPGRRIEVKGSAVGAFTVYDFPLANPSFRAVLNGNDLVIDPLRLDFAQGSTTGRVRVNVTPGKERLGFDLDLKAANLRQATSILDNYAAKRRGEPPADGGAYVQNSANVTMDLGLSAEGDLQDLYSYVGTGNAELSGNGLGEIRLLGLLSELLNFTSLRFNNLRANFSLDKNKIVFPEVSITGSNSSVSAHGSYALDKRALDFKARIYPFEESKFILKNVLGAVLTPLSTVLEVKLTGRLDKPSWSFVIGPTNFLRSLTQSAEDKPTSPADQPKPPDPIPAPASPTPPKARK